MTDKKKESRVLWKWLAVLAVMFGVALIAIRMYGHSYVPQDVRDQVSEWERTIVSLPEDWHKPADLPSKEVEKFHQNLAAEMRTVRNEYQLLLNGPDDRSGLLTRPALKLKKDEETSFALLMADLHPLIDETSETVILPDYNFDTDLVLASDAVSELDILTFAKLLIVIAKERARVGDCEPAIHAATLALRLFQRQEQTNLIYHLIAVIMVGVGSESMYAIGIQCADTRTLSGGLNLLEQLRDKVLPDPTHIELAELLVPLRYAAAYGYPVNLSPQSYADFLRQGIALYDAQYYHWIIDNLPAGSTQVRTARENLLSFHSESEFSYSLRKEAHQLFLRPKIFKLVTGIDIDIVRTAGIRPNYLEANRRVQDATTRYDLARMGLAYSLAKLGDTGSTVTAFLSPLPHDPFTSEPFLFSNKLDTYYSVGPDKADDKAAVIYDATNGTVSAGDIWLE